MKARLPTQCFFRATMAPHRRSLDFDMPQTSRRGFEDARPGQLGLGGLVRRLLELHFPPVRPNGLSSCS